MAFHTLALSLALSLVWALAETPPAANLRAQKTPVDQPAPPAQMKEEVAATAAQNLQPESEALSEKSEEPQEKEEQLEQHAADEESKEALLQESEEAAEEDESATAEGAEEDGEDELW